MQREVLASRADEPFALPCPRGAIAFLSAVPTSGGDDGRSGEVLSSNDEAARPQILSGGTDPLARSRRGRARFLLCTGAGGWYAPVWCGLWWGRGTRPCSGSRGGESAGRAEGNDRARDATAGRGRTREMNGGQAVHVFYDADSDGEGRPAGYQPPPVTKHSGLQQTVPAEYRQTGNTVKPQVDTDSWQRAFLLSGYPRGGEGPFSNPPRLIHGQSAANQQGRVGRL